MPRTHQRLEDAHALWHQAAASYRNPLAFRERLADLLPALRGAVVALQRDTRVRQDFQAWHDDWQQRIRSHEALGWLMHAGRHEIGEDELKAVSTASVTLLAGPKGQPLAQFSVPPFADPATIPGQLLGTRMRAVVESARLMLLERRWSIAGLPGLELLDALAGSWAALVEPFDEAHAGARASTDHDAPRHQEPGSSLTDLLASLLAEGHRPPCMSLSRAERVSVFRLHDGQLVRDLPDVEGDEIEGERPQGNPLMEKAAGNRAASEQVDPLRRLAWHFEEARRELIRTGSCNQQVRLFVPGQEWVPATLLPAELQDRYQLWGRMAREVERTGAIAVMTAFEAPGRRPGETSRLVLLAETALGEHRTLSASFERRAGQLRFGRVRAGEDGRRWYFLEPVRQAWGERL